MVNKNMNDKEALVNLPQSPHAVSSAELFKFLDSSENGLDENTVAKRILQYGKNALLAAPPIPGWKRFLLQFQNVLIYVLITSAIISLILQHWVDSGVIFTVVLVNAIVGFIQEGKAEQALRAISSLTSTHSLVIRNGVSLSIDSKELVPGDVVTIQAGDKVPADLRLFFCKDLQCNESALTGESQAVEKNTELLSGNIALADQTNMAFMGTMVTFGVARGIVCYTGASTEIGSINELVQSTGATLTPLQKHLKHFAQQLSAGIVVVSLLCMAFGVLYRQFEFAEMFQAAIGIAVASIPEGLPAIVTIALAIGVQRMSKNKALVRRLPSVEVLGSVDIICSDKTGTLTTNEMTVRVLINVSGQHSITGEGYRPEGSITLASKPDLEKTDTNSLLERAGLLSLLCNDSTIMANNGEWELHGDPTEGALLTLAMKSGITTDDSKKQWPRIDELPFETDRRYMATLHKGSSGEKLLALKGAPERILGFCDSQLGSKGVEPFNSEYWQAAIITLAEKGMRVMALAQKTISEHVVALDHSCVESNMTIVSLVGISDPPRPEAIESIHACHEAGITVKMITGDNPLTAAAIGKELGLNTKKILTGSDLDELNEKEIREAVEEVDIFARASPANKLKLVEVLQNNNHVVAMTGDGVNDAPALRKADIGVAMGKKGTDAAKEASDIILTDDLFSTIKTAIVEGRTVYDNIVKSIIFILPTSLAEAVVIIISIIAGQIWAITPAQIIWVNMVTTVTLALALAFEQSEPNLMKRPPRPKKQGLITISLLVRVIVVGVYAASIIYLAFMYYRDAGSSIETARTIAVNLLVMIEAFYLMNCRFLTQCILTKRIFVGSAPSLLAIFSVILLQVIFTYLPVSQKIFGLESIGSYDWMFIIIMALPILLIVEMEKYIWRIMSVFKANKMKFLEV